MKPSPSYYSLGIIKQNLKQHGWIGILFLADLLFALPLQLLMSEQEPGEPLWVDNLFTLSGGFLYALLLTAPVLTGLFLCRYMQSRQLSNLYHSLPVTRGTLYASHLASGLILLLIPIWLNTAVLAVVREARSSMYHITDGELLRWTASITVLTLFLFVFTVFVGICTGQSILQGVVVYILLLLPVGFMTMINYHLAAFLYGYAGTRGSFNRGFSPLIRVMEAGSSPFGYIELAIYLALTVVFALLGAVLYRRRHVEAATQAIAFTYFNPLFQVGVMLCAMLVSGTYFSLKKSGNPLWMLTGYLLGAILGFAATEMLLRKSWHIVSRKAFLMFGGYLAGTGILLYAVSSNLTGFETRVPELEHIRSVMVGRDTYWQRDLRLFSEDKDYIESVRKLHLRVTEQRSQANLPLLIKDNPSAQSVSITYQLANGDSLMRYYTLPWENIAPELQAVMETKGYKTAQYKLKGLDKPMDRIELLANGTNSRKLVLTHPEDINEFKQALKEDYLSMSYEDQENKRVPWASIEMLESGTKNYYYYDWKKSFSRVEQWLARKGYLEIARINPTDILSAELVHADQSIIRANLNRSQQQLFELLAVIGPVTAISGQEELSRLLDNLDYQFTGLTDGYMVRLKSPAADGELYYYINGRLE